MATRGKTTTAKGLGWTHQQAADELRRNHPDGSPCDWCGRPMYLDRTLNWDYNPEATNPGNGSLHADHSEMSRAEAIKLGLPIPRPNRLLHGACNVQRGQGANDHLAANTNNRTPEQQLLIAWPW